MIKPIKTAPLKIRFIYLISRGAVHYICDFDSKLFCLVPREFHRPLLSNIQLTMNP